MRHEPTNHERQALSNAVTECVKHADCDTLADIFRAADWTWSDLVTGEDYHPTAREIRNELYRLGKSAMHSAITTDFEPSMPLSCNHSSGRLYFCISWHPEDGSEARFLEDMEMQCGLTTHCANTYITDISANTYSVDTYAEGEEEYKEVFDKIGEECVIGYTPNE